MTNNRHAKLNPVVPDGVQKRGRASANGRLRGRSISGAVRAHPRSRSQEVHLNEIPRRPKIGDTLTAAVAIKGNASERQKRRRRGRVRGRGKNYRAPDVVSAPVEAVTLDEPVELDKSILQRRRGRTRKGRPLGRYTMHVHVGKRATHIAILEGRRLIQYFVSRPSDDSSEIYGNIYLGRVQNVLPGMETAFVDIGTPKNAVLYASGVQYDPNKHKSSEKANGKQPRIEDLLDVGQEMLCQVTKNPIGAKGARLCQGVSLAGRFVVLVPETLTGSRSKGSGVSKRLPTRERKRLGAILERVKSQEYGLILRTAAENVTELEIERDIARLVSQWEDIKRLAEKSTAPALLYREPEATLRLIREELTSEYRMITIDDRALFEDVSSYISSIMPPLSDRVKFYDVQSQKLPLFERYYVFEQLVKALNPKVWLPSGGSIIIEHTEALTVIDVNTGRNVGKSNLEDTVLVNNLEAAEEIARQLRLRNVGGLIVVDFVDMEVPSNRELVVKKFKESLACDKTRTQVLDISSLGLLEMTRKRVGIGLLESLSTPCSTCSGRGWELYDDILEGRLE